MIPGIFVDIEEVMETKKAMLSCHKSQQSWLDVSQGNNAYLQDLVDRGEYFGRISKRYKYAEGWIRHNPLGFCGPDDNPLMDVLGAAGKAFINEEFEKTTRVENYM